jgi:hypothetical protein
MGNSPKHPLLFCSSRSFFAFISLPISPNCAQQLYSKPLLLHNQQQLSHQPTTIKWWLRLFLHIQLSFISPWQQKNKNNSNPFYCNQQPQNIYPDRASFKLHSWNFQRVSLLSLVWLYGMFKLILFIAVKRRFVYFLW